MKVYIGPYKKWYNVYTLASMIPFISEDRADSIGEWLSKNTKLQSLFDWFNGKQDRKIKVHIDPYDTWSMDDTLAHIILPMLKQLKATKNGSHIVDDEDVPAHMRHGDPYGHDNWIQYKWEWVLGEMIWAFEQQIDDSWEDQFIHGTPVYDWNKWEDDNGVPYQRVQLSQTNPDYWVDRDGIKEYNKRIDNGFMLFGKYYRGLWD